MGLTLEEAIRRAARTERVEIAGRLDRAARARVARARSLFLPDVTLTGSYARRAHDSTPTIDGRPVTVVSEDAFQGAVAVAITLFDARAFPLYRQASRSAEAARLDAADEQRRVAFAVADAFLIALGAEQILAAARERFALAEKAHAEARARFAAGLVSSNDVTRAELEIAVARREVERAEADVKTAYLDLRLLTDSDVAGPLVPPAELLEAAALPTGDPATLVARARGARPDLAASRRRAEAARAFAEEPLRRLIPTLGLLGQFRVADEGGLAASATDWSVSLTATFWLYDGGERYADRAERLALAEAAELETRALARDVDRQVRGAAVLVESAREAVLLAERAVELAAQNVRETSELYRQGLRGSLDVTDASVRLFEAQVALARERYGLGLAFLDLRAALGLDPLGREVSP